MMRMVRAFGALLILLMVVVGVPVLLLAFGAVPPPHTWPAALTAPDDGTVLIGLLTVIGWLAWLVVTAAVLSETVAVVSRQRIRIRLPGLGWLQGVAAVLVIAALGGAVPATAHDSAPVVVVTGTSTPAVAVDSAVTGEPDGAERYRGPGVSHRVQAGDDLWSLAEHYYRDGAKWRQIASANPELLTGGPDLLRAGWELFIPAEDAAPVEAMIRVHNGDTLSGLAADHLGDAARWPELWHLNRAVLNHPDEVPAGISLRVPTKDNTAPPGREQSPGPDHGEADEDPPAASIEPEPGTEQEPGTRPEPSAEPSPTSPATTRPAPTESKAAEQTADGPSTTVVANVDLTAALGGIGALLAAGLVGSFAARRLIQLHERPVGRRVAHPDPGAERLAAALHTVRAPGGRAGLALAQELVARHCRKVGAAPPILDHVLVGPDRVELVVTEAGSPPTGFTVDGRRWVLTAPERSAVAEPVGSPWPALVTLGRLPDADTEILIDLERWGDLGVDLDDPTDARALVRGIVLDLIANPGAPRVVVVGGDPDLLAAADVSHVSWCADPDELLTELEDRAAHHHLDPDDRPPGVIRLEVERAEAWQPVLVVLDTPLTARQRRRLTGLLDDPRTPVVVLRTMAPAAHNLTGDADRVRLDGSDVDFTPHLVAESARDRVVELFRVTGSTSTTPAPWWSPTAPATDPTGPDPARVLATGTRQELPVTIANHPSERPGPMVQLLGPIDLTGATGTEPIRARKQCIEYCAWLLENPGRTSREMASQLFVAEATRRSNMSRLRTWLGHDPKGLPYLPEAYSGRITLHDEVISDWQLLQQLVPGDIRQAKDSTLVAALEMVRGAPLADAAPQQWGWAEELRLDMVSMIRDIAWVLADRARQIGDLDRVRWATSRGLTAAPDDELLMSQRLRAEHEAGNISESERLSRRIIARARTLDVDLLDDTVDLLQEIAEGQVRARRAL